MRVFRLSLTAALLMGVGCVGADPEMQAWVDQGVPSAEAEKVGQARLQAALEAYNLAHPGSELDLATLTALASSGESIVLEPEDVSPESDRPPSGGVEALDEELIERAMELGFEASELIVKQGWVVAEHDTLLDPEVLRSGGYLPTIEKGYRLSRLVNSTHDGNIKLAFEPFFAQNASGTIAAWLAAEAWSNNTTVSISTANTGPTITIRPRINPPCDDGAPACAPAPKNGKPGDSIYVRIDFRGATSGRCSWDFDSLSMVLAHEMGHTIGVAHPSPLEGTLVADTEFCRVPGPWTFICTEDPGYETIMSYANYDATNCRVRRSSLSDDDYEVSSKLYKLP